MPTSHSSFTPPNATPKKLGAELGSANLALLGAIFFATSCTSPRETAEADAAPSVDAQSASPLAQVSVQTIDANVVCSESSCEIFATEAACPTTPYARGRADGGRELVFDGPERDTLYWATQAGLRRLETGAYLAFSQPRDGRVWVLSETEIRQYDQDGSVWRIHTDLPFDDGEGYAVERAGLGVVVAGGTEPTTSAWHLAGTTWTPIETKGAQITNLVALDDDTLILGAYGYFFRWNTGQPAAEQFGGSDALLDQAVRCGSPDAYWTGGGTGLAVHCGPNVECSGFHEVYAFQSASVGCLDGNLASLQGGVISATTPDGVTTTEEAPGLRHLWADLGVTWVVSPPK